MHDAGALLQGDEIAQVHRRVAIVERMPERESFQRRSRGGREHRALEPVTLQAAIHELAGKQQHSARSAHQRIAEIRMHVECLVGW